MNLCDYSKISFPFKRFEFNNCLSNSLIDEINLGSENMYTEALNCIQLLVMSSWHVFYISYSVFYL